MEKLPSHLTGLLADFGPESPQFCQVVLDAGDVQAIDEALAAFKALRLDGPDISRENFVLPAGLSERLAAATKEVHHGRGLCQIRGLDPGRYSEADNLLLYLGLASYVGDKRGIQDMKGNVISHITDAKSWKIPYEQRHDVHTNRSLAWHCDMGADILALQVRQVAEKGGATMVASSWKIYNDLMRERPDVLGILARQDWPVHMPNRKTRHVLAALLDFHNGKLLVSFDPSRLGTHPAMQARRPRAGVIPALTDMQREALDVVAGLAERNAVALDSRPGDLLFLNNWALMHARSAYVDAEGAEGAGAAGAAGARRHLLRLWLRNSVLGWKIPESLRTPWEAAYSYADEGYVSGDHPSDIVSQLKYPVMPDPEYTPTKYTSGSAAFVLDKSDGDEED